MGGKQSSHQERVIPFNQRDWQLSNKSGPNKVWTHRMNPTIAMQEHQIQIGSNKQLEKAQDVYRLRNNDQQLVSGLYSKFKKEDSMCSKSYSGSVYTEHIPRRLGSFGGLNFPDTLHAYDQAFRGYQKLYRECGPFKINQQCIGVNRQNIAKVWHNPSFDDFQPHRSARSEAETVKSIVRTLDANTNVASMPPQEPSFSSFLYRNNEEVGFAEARRKLQEYANYFNRGVIPTHFGSESPIEGVHSAGMYGQNHAGYNTSLTGGHYGSSTNQGHLVHGGVSQAAYGMAHYTHGNSHQYNNQGYTSHTNYHTNQHIGSHDTRYTTHTPNQIVSNSRIRSNSLPIMRESSPYQIHHPINHQNRMINYNSYNNNSSTNLAHTHTPVAAHTPVVTHTNNILSHSRIGHISSPVITNTNTHTHNNQNNSSVGQVLTRSAASFNNLPYTTNTPRVGSNIGHNISQPIHTQPGRLISTGQNIQQGGIRQKSQAQIINTQFNKPKSVPAPPIQVRQVINQPINQVNQSVNKSITQKPTVTIQQQQPQQQKPIINNNTSVSIPQQRQQTEQIVRQTQPQVIQQQPQQQQQSKSIGIGKTIGVAGVIGAAGVATVGINNNNQPQITTDPQYQPSSNITITNTNNTINNNNNQPKIATESIGQHLNNNNNTTLQQVNNNTQQNQPQQINNTLPSTQPILAISNIPAYTGKSDPFANKILQQQFQMQQLPNNNTQQQPIALVQQQNQSAQQQQQLIGLTQKQSNQMVNNNNISGAMIAGGATAMTVGGVTAVTAGSIIGATTGGATAGGVTAIGASTGTNQITAQQQQPQHTSNAFSNKILQQQFNMRKTQQTQAQSPPIALPISPQNNSQSFTQNIINQQYNMNQTSTSQQQQNTNFSTNQILQQQFRLNNNPQSPAANPITSTTPNSNNIPLIGFIQQKPSQNYNNTSSRGVAGRKDQANQSISSLGFSNVPNRTYNNPDISDKMFYDAREEQSINNSTRNFYTNLVNNQAYSQSEIVGEMTASRKVGSGTEYSSSGIMGMGAVGGAGGVVGGGYSSSGYGTSSYGITSGSGANSGGTSQALLQQLRNQGGGGTYISYTSGGDDNNKYQSYQSYTVTNNSPKFQSYQFQSKTIQPQSSAYSFGGNRINNNNDYNTTSNFGISNNNNNNYGATTTTVMQQYTSFGSPKSDYTSNNNNNNYHISSSSQYTTTKVTTMTSNYQNDNDYIPTYQTAQSKLYQVSRQGYGGGSYGSSDMGGFVSGNNTANYGTAGGEEEYNVEWDPQILADLKNAKNFE